MDPIAKDSSLEPPADAMPQKRAAKGSVSDVPIKKTFARKGEQSAADYLLDQNRIGWINHQPIGKRRYILLKFEDTMNALSSLYTHFFRMHDTHFRRSLERAAASSTRTKDVSEYAANVYLSHWIFDTYRTIRDCVKKLDPIAFNESYFHEVATSSEIYDNFLTYLNSSLRPTQINFNTAEEMYIPLFSQDLDWTKNFPFPWSKYIYDYTSFLTITYIMENKKLCTMTPLSSDPTGRPFWLFDWDPTGKQAYAWFPMENNFNTVDVTAAFIIGVACSPKLGSCDRDAWTHFDPSLAMKELKLDHLTRKTPRIWRGNAEFRTFEYKEAIPFPHVSEKDEAKFKLSNKGTYAIRSSFTDDADASSSSGDKSDTTVPSSPRMGTRSSTTITVDKGVHRARILDFCYNGQVVLRIDDTTRVAAFKKFIS